MQPTAFLKSFAEIHGIGDPEKKATKLQELAPHLSKGQLWIVSSSGVGDNDASVVLKALAPWIAPKLGLRLVADVLCRILDMDIRADALRAFQPYWLDRDRVAAAETVPTRYLSPEEFKDGLVAVRSIKNAKDRANAYDTLVLKLTDKQFSILLEEVASIDNEDFRETILLGGRGLILIRQLVQRLPNKIFAMLDTFTNEEPRANIIGAVARLLPREHVRKLVLEAHKLQSESLRAGTVAAGTFNLMQAAPEDTIALALSVSDDQLFALALFEVALHTPPRLINDVIMATSRIKNERFRAHIYAALSKTWTKEQYASVLPAMKDIEDQRGLADLFARIGRPLTLIAAKPATSIGKKRIAPTTLQASNRKVQSASAAAPNNIEQTLIPDKIRKLGSRGHQNERNNTGEQTEGRLSDQQKKNDIVKGLEGLRAFVLAVGGSEAHSTDESVIAGATVAVAKSIVAGRPYWDDRARYEDLRQLRNAPLFLRKVYGDLLERGPYLPDGRSVWHLRLSDGQPVWQEAVRSNDRKIVQIVIDYVNKRRERKLGLGDAKGLVFERKIVRGGKSKPKTRKSLVPRL